MYSVESICLLLCDMGNKCACLFLSRLVMYVERDLRKATPLRENPSQSGYLSQCVDLLIVYLSSTAPLILGKETQPQTHTLIK